MSPNPLPTEAELPSAGRLLRSTAMAAGIAAALLVTTVLPAEYGVDPTGVGALLGLTEMGRVKRALAAEDAVAKGDPPPTLSDNLMPPDVLEAQPASPVPSGVLVQSNETGLTLAPDEAAEIKLEMRSGAQAQFAWSTGGGRVNFDIHGDGVGVDYHGYGKGTAASGEGVLTAAFDGNHGWFWRNRTGAPVTITLKTSGSYARIKRAA